MADSRRKLKANVPKSPSEFAPPPNPSAVDSDDTHRQMETSSFKASVVSLQSVGAMRALLTPLKLPLKKANPWGQRHR